MPFVHGESGGIQDPNEISIVGPQSDSHWIQQSQLL